MTAYKARGFTLIESVVAIVILAISMTVLTTVLFPRIENSAASHYQVRASALAQSMMTEILSRAFDENSDQNGGLTRCDEPEPGTVATNCTSAPFTPATQPEVAGLYDDVDDYVGCWYTDITQSSCMEPQAGKLSDVLGNDIDTAYANFRVEVKVIYDNHASLTSGVQPAGKNVFKLIELIVYPGKYGSYRFVAYRGNY